MRSRKRKPRKSTGPPTRRTLAWPEADFTGCQVCHFHEVELEPGRFANNPIRPPDEMIVPLEVLKRHAADAVGDG